MWSPSLCVYTCACVHVHTLLMLHTLHTDTKQSHFSLLYWDSTVSPTPRPGYWGIEHKFSIKEKLNTRKSGARAMAWGIKVLATKPHDLSFIQESHMMKGEE